MNQFALWHEMCKNEQISPDIVTLTEVIATLDSASGKGNRQRGKRGRRKEVRFVKKSVLTVVQTYVEHLENINGCIELV